MADEPAIRVAGLTKNYGSDVEALAGVDLEIEKGTTYALLGPNGAGKTTAVRILAGMTQRTGGEVSVLGLDPEDDGKELRGRIGITFQETLLDEALTGRQTLEFHGRLYGMSRKARRAKAQELLSLMQLEDAAGRKTKTYSGGMKRRLEIARSIMTDPEVLFIDEPTLGVDPQNRITIWDYISKLKSEQGVSILLTTHYMDEAQEIADVVGIIDDGRLVAQGNPTDLIADLGDERVVILIGGGADVDTTALESLEEVTSVSAGKEGISVSVASAAAAIAPIARFLDARGVPIDSLDIQRPSLGEVFLRATGHELRD